jgi:hypothetical protein
VVKKEGAVVGIEGGVVKKCKTVVKIIASSKCCSMCTDKYNDNIYKQVNTEQKIQQLNNG